MLFSNYVRTEKFNKKHQKFEKAENFQFFFSVHTKNDVFMQYENTKGFPVPV